MRVASALPIPKLAAPVDLVSEPFARSEVWPAGTAPNIEGRAVVSDIPTPMMAGS